MGEVNMKLTLFITQMVFILGSAQYVMSNDQNKINISIDKGTVMISFIEGNNESSAVQYTYKKVNECEAEVEMNEDGNNFTIEHTKQACPTGTHIELKLKKGNSYKLNLTGGVIEVRRSGELFNNFDSITASVKGGVIQSQVKKLNPTKKYGSATLHYENDKALNKSLTLDVTGGVIQFSR